MLIQIADTSINCHICLLTNCKMVESSYHYQNCQDYYYYIIFYVFFCLCVYMHILYISRWHLPCNLLLLLLLYILVFEMRIFSQSKDNFAYITIILGGIPFSMAILNVELMHECFPKHSRMRQQE